MRSRFVFPLMFVGVAAAAEPDTAALLKSAVIDKALPRKQVADYCEARVPRMPQVAGAEEWKKKADAIREDVLRNVVLRGMAAEWAKLPTRVQWLEEIPGGPGYTIRKLRFEAIPGLWIPALLYKPEKLVGKVPVFLNVNGHDGAGKAAGYKQIRCINLARRGILALNVEWLGMGQLKTPGFRHYLINEWDLCGTSGVSSHFLSMKRCVDILLSLENADPTRVGVAGLSGGGWQTIFIGSLDPRLTLINPVAGYSSFLTRARVMSDLGDSEQTPSDLAAHADYCHLTAMCAPRATLLTYNEKDNCCFASGHALPPLIDAALPVFKLFGKEPNLRSHINRDPGTHNFEIDNRQALYRMVGDHFFAGDKTYDAQEFPVAKAEVRSADELKVDLPADNLDFHKIALDLAKNLPRDREVSVETATAAWRNERRQELRGLLRVKDLTATDEEVRGSPTHVLRRLHFGKDWTIPCVELIPPAPKRTVILIADTGRAGASAEAQRLLDSGARVLAIDPFYFGESKIDSHDFLYAMLVASVGDRPLGIQAAQVAATARWAKAKFGSAPSVSAVGPRTSLIALCAAVIEPEAIFALDLTSPWGSLKEVIEQAGTVDKTPEVFCFGLLERFDIKQLAAVCSPRKVTVRNGSERATKELVPWATFVP